MVSKERQSIINGFLETAKTDLMAAEGSGLWLSEDNEFIITLIEDEAECFKAAAGGGWDYQWVHYFNTSFVQAVMHDVDGTIIVVTQDQTVTLRMDTGDVVAVMPTGHSIM